MLCEALWEEERARRGDNRHQSSGGGGGGHHNDDEKQDDGDDEKNNDDGVRADSPKDVDGNDDDDAPPHTYERYKRDYSLDYIRGFFNAHLDDEWFRLRYSPLHRRRAAVRRRERAAAEALAVRDEIRRSAATFLAGARLGVGERDAVVGDRRSRDPVEVPASHWPSGHARCALEIRDVPPRVTDAQLSHAVGEHASVPPVRVVGTTVGATSVKRRHCDDLTRTCWAIFVNEEAKEEMVENLTKANLESGRLVGDRDRVAAAGVIPTVLSSDASSDGGLELEVECSDAFGRSEIDADGAGGAPPADAEGRIPKLPSRRETVRVVPREPRPEVAVLSVAVSRASRIPRDRAAAYVVARALDAADGVPEGRRLDDCAASLPEDVSEEDSLDAAVAYLRRVHLFSFYGCSTAASEGDALAGPESTVWLRCAKDADEAMDEDDDERYKDDLLVKRLDSSVARALEESQARVGAAAIFVDEATDAAAAALEEEEAEARQRWLRDHAITDADGRARCSLHFCRKLFKDRIFLHKHLLKKHPEYLAAEQAKTHDERMMRAWEAESVRPVPRILVDCGDRLGLVPTDVYGTTPTADDPAPALRRAEEEETARRREEEERRERWGRERRAAAAAARRDEERGDAVESRNDRPGGGGGGGGGFVDVDDVKDEKVELSFDDVALPAVPPKKRKRKKKKIL